MDIAFLKVTTISAIQLKKTDSLGDANVQKDTLLATLGELGFKEGSLPQVAHHHGVTSLDQLLNLFVKQLYLEKNSRSDRESPVYTWGPRAKVEFLSDHMVHFILSVSFDLHLKFCVGSK